MASDLDCHVFLCHSAKDKAVVRPLAERLRKDRVKGWFDEWVLKPGDRIPAKIEGGLERPRVLVLCMSAGEQSALLHVKRPEQASRVAEATNTFDSYRKTLL